MWFLDQELQQYELNEITAQLGEIPNLYIAFSLFLSFLSYLLLTGYDALGVRYIGEDLEMGKIVRAGYVGYAFSHNIGLALITGGSIRYRIYSAWGFSGMQVTQIVAFSAFTLWIGFCAVAGLALLLATPNLPSEVVLPYLSFRVLGILLLVMVVAYVWASAKFKKEISFKSWSFSFPNLKLSLKQVAIASVDWLLAASVLYVLLPEAGISFFRFVGVFESVMLLYLSNFMAGSQVLGILLVYRIIYYILPLLGAIVVLGYQEYLVNRKKVQEFREKATDWVPRVVPQVMSFSVFIGGAILLFSGALPSEVPRMHWLQHFIPLPVIEMSHFFASLVGAALLVLAGALQRRIDGAYHLTVGLLVFGVIFSLLKGADYEEASVLAVMLGVLIPCREEFHRKASLFNRQFSIRWFTLIMMVLISAVWLGIFSYRHVEYQRELWWEFSLMGDAPRYLRATVAALGFAVIVGLVKLLRPRSVTAEPRDRELEVAREIIKKSGNATSNLVLSADKDLFFNEERNSFIMYLEEGRSYIALGDPVGPGEEAENIIWDYCEYVENDGARPVFYLAGSDYLEYYVDQGLTLFKLGEEARVPLGQKELFGQFDSKVIENVQRIRGEGYEWELLPPGAAGSYIGELKEISELCLKEQNREERGFSVGRFDEQFLQHFPIAVVRREGRIIAFSNILQGAGNREMAIDLLRYRPEASEGTVDYLIFETMKWGREHDYGYFNLGMAPLSGMEDRESNSGWNRLADFVYTYGEAFYGFKQVRAYKSHFNPKWVPRFLVCPGGWSLPRDISNLTNVASGGFSSLLRTKNR